MAELRRSWWIDHPLGATNRTCPECGKPQTWCGSVFCHEPGYPAGHWSHVTEADGDACGVFMQPAVSR